MRLAPLRIVLLLAAALGAALPAIAADLAEVRVDGDELVAELTLDGVTAAELTVAFEEALGLTPEALGLSAGTVGNLDSSVLGRLPPLVSLPAALPLVVRIEPPATGALSFSGVASIGLYTHALTYAADSPLRLFAAHDGGPFEDVTAAMGAGSYRVRGSKGDFSEFMIVADLRPPGAVIAGKLDRLDGLLADHAAAIDPQLYVELAALATEARAHHAAGDPVGALERVDELAEAVEAADGSAVPDVWRSAGDLVNVAGLLRAAADTLHFSLALASNQP